MERYLRIMCFVERFRHGFSNSMLHSLLSSSPHDVLPSPNIAALHDERPEDSEEGRVGQDANLCEDSNRSVGMATIAEQEKELLSSVVDDTSSYSGSDPLHPWLWYGTTACRSLPSLSRDSIS
jgi:hypothetical protein